ncbi:MAG: PAS domain S-box protein, partial [Bradymonadaceae bacterium]
ETEQRELASVQGAVLNAMPAHIALLDSKGQVVTVNEAWRRFGEKNGFMGVDFGVGTNYLEACRDDPEVEAGIRAVLGGAPRFSKEYPSHSPTEERWFRLIVTPVKERNRQGALIMHLDVTDLRESQHRVASGERLLDEAERQRRESEERFRLVASVMSGTVWDWNVKKDLLSRSQGIEVGFGAQGQDPSPMVGWIQNLHPDDKERVMAGIREVLEGTAMTWTDEYRFQLPDGSYLLLKSRGVVIRDEEGQAVRVVGGSTDVTREREADRRLAEQAALLDEARDAILVRELDHTITYWNRSAERLYGWSVEEIIGRSVEELYSDVAPFLEAMQAVMKYGEWTGEL